MHIYLIESSDVIVINNKIDEILKKNNLDKSNMIRHSMQEISISSVVEELDTYNFLINTKVIVCDDCFFLSSTKVKPLVEHNLEYLKKYILNPNMDNYLILVCDKLSDKKDIKEMFTTNVEIVNTKIATDILVKDRLEDFKISPATINYLINYCLRDNEKILNELEKLKLFKFSEKEITNDDIDMIVIRDFDENVFDLVNAVVKRKRQLAYEIYKRLMVTEKDSTIIVASVASNIRNMYSTKVLLKEGKSVDAIAEHLSVKPGAVSIAMENGRSFSEKTLLTLLNRLADLDIAIKTGNSSNDILFELFLLKL